MLSTYMYEVHGVGVVHAGMSLSKDRSRAYCVRSSVHLTRDNLYIISDLTMVEARTAEEAKSLSKSESCDRKPIIAADL